MSLEWIEQEARSFLREERIARDRMLYTPPNAPIHTPIDQPVDCAFCGKIISTDQPYATDEDGDIVHLWCAVRPCDG